MVERLLMGLDGPEEGTDVIAQGQQRADQV